MVFVRLIVLAAMAATVWLSVDAGAHGAAVNHAAMHDVAMHEDGHTDHRHGPSDVDCCDVTAERGASCASLFAVAPTDPSVAVSTGMARVACSILGTLPDGRDPKGLTEPPRTV